MFDVPGSNISAVYIDEKVVEGKAKAQYVTGPVETSEVNADESSDSFQEEQADNRTTA